MAPPSVHAIDNVDAQIVICTVRHDHLAKDTGNIVGTVLFVTLPISAGQNITVVLAGEDICRAAGGRLVKKAHDAADRARTVAIVGIGAKAAEVEGFFNRAAVFQPGGNDAADIVGAAVKPADYFSESGLRILKPSYFPMSQRAISWQPILVGF